MMLRPFMDEAEIAICSNFLTGAHWVVCTCSFETVGFSNAWQPLQMGENHLKEGRCYNVPKEAPDSSYPPV